MEVKSETTGSSTVLHLSGRIDATVAPVLDRRLNEAVDSGRGGLLLDFAKVEYISSAGLRVLLLCVRNMKAASRKLVLYAVNDDVMDVIKLTGFNNIMHICENEDEALAAASAE